MLTHGAVAFADSRGWSPSHAGTPANSAVLVHCTAGKDRTGVAIALLLDAVGADRSAVIDDYASSEANLAGAWAERMFAMIAAGRPACTGAGGARRGNARCCDHRGAARWVDREHGGSAGYFAPAG